MFWFKKKARIQGEDFLNGVTDIHCHLLPGVDDGFNTLEASNELLCKEQEIGVKRIYFTPHSMGASGAVVDPRSYAEIQHRDEQHSEHHHHNHKSGKAYSKPSMHLDDSQNKESVEEIKRRQEKGELISSVVVQAAREREYDNIDYSEEFKKEPIGGYSDNHLRKKFEYFKNFYTGNIDIRLAAEYMMNKEFLEKVKTKDLLTYSDGHHVLVETSYFFPPIEMDEILYTLKIEGFTPILAHPERYRYMSKEDYKRLKGKDIKFQLNYLSLTGYYGKHVLQKALDLLDNDMYNFTGSDYHRTSTFVHQAHKLKLSHKRADKLIRLFENNNTI